MNPYFQTPNTQEEWNQAIISDGLHLKWHEEVERPEAYPHSQLSKMMASFQDKRDLLSADIDTKTELAANGDLAAEADVEVYWRLDKFIQLIQKEIEFRQNNVYVRSPIGTTYYVDPANGNDANTGTGTGSGDAWATIRKFVEGARSAGDICIVRRDTTNMSDGTLTTATPDGQVYNPIILEADYDDTWGDFTSSAQTYTIAAGSKTATASATITGISVGDWIYVQGDDARLHCLEVSSVSGTTLSFYLPYKGNNFGSGKTLTVMGPNPVNGSTLTGDGIYFNTAIWWIVRGIHSKGAYANGCWYFANARTILQNCIGEATGLNGNAGLNMASYTGLKVSNFRTKGGHNGNSINLGHNNGFVVLEHIDVDGTKSGTAEILRGIYAQAVGMMNTTFKDIHIRNVGNGVGIDFAVTANLGTTRCKNITFDNNSAGDVKVGYTFNAGQLTSVVIEDYNGVKGDTRMFSGNGPAELDSPWCQTDTGVSRAGGAAAALKVIPSTGMGGDHFMGGYPLVGEQVSNSIVKGVPVYLTAGSKTVSFYFKTASTADWTSNPTANEFYIEVEYLADSSNVTNSLKRSTGTLNFTGSTDWQALSASFTTGQAGLAYIKLIYSKTKEASVSNIFWFDPHIEIS